MSASETIPSVRTRRSSRSRSPRRDQSGPGVRVLETGAGTRAIVEVTCAKADNPLYRAFSVLRALGVQIVHAEVRAVRDRMIQRLYLQESDGRSLEPSRLTEALVALGRARPLRLSESAQMPSLCA
jgi:UTP:GlnB (protein PII) uridylyltransferase